MANYPGALSTNANLYIAVNGLQTTLAASCTSGDTTLTLTSTTGFPTTGLVTIDNTEVVSYTGVSGATITGCTRGADGTTAASHPIGVTVGLTVVAAHHNLLKDEIIAIETALGISLANVFPATPTTGTGNVVLATNPVLVTPNLGTPSVVNLANATNLPNSATTATPAATASTIVSRDANVNARVNHMTENFATTVTAAGTTALTVTSSKTQQFTGTSTQTVTLPDATTLTLGFEFVILNRSTGAVTVNNNGGSLQKSVPASTQYIFTVTNIGSANGTWDVSSDAGTGTVTSVSGTASQIASTGGTTPVLSLTNPLLPPGAIQGVVGSQSVPTYAFAGHTNTGIWEVSDTLAVSANGSVAAQFTATSGQFLTGETDGTAPGAGNVGEFVSSTVSLATTGGSTGADFNATSISLTAGDWDVSAMGFFNPNGATLSNGELSISTTSATSGTLGDNANRCSQVGSTTNEINVGIPLVRISVTVTTTVYLVTQIAYTGGTARFAGNIRARRVR